MQQKIHSANNLLQISTLHPLSRLTIVMLCLNAIYVCFFVF